MIRKIVRGGARCDQVEDGRAAREGVAEAGPAVLVAGEEVLDELAELHVPGLVETEAVRGSARAPPASGSCRRSAEPDRRRAGGRRR